MKRDKALIAARARATPATGIGIWEHIGDDKVPAQGRFITRPVSKPPPRFGRWAKVVTVTRDPRTKQIREERHG